MEEEYSLQFPYDGRVVTCFPITFGLSNHVYTYNVAQNDEIIDTGFIILGTKTVTLIDDEKEVSDLSYVYVRLVESSNVYLEETEYLYERVEDALDSLIPDLVNASGSSSYMSRFL